MARITLDNVTKSWGDTRVLQPMTLSIEDGEFVAVLGPSGCGKSTTLFLLAGLYAPTAGQISFDGHNVNRINRARFITHCVCAAFGAVAGVLIDRLL